MSTVIGADAPETTAVPDPPAIGRSPATGRRTPPPIRPVTFPTLLGVEARKLVDTRAGTWLLIGGVVLAAMASAAVILWAPEETQTYNTMSSAVGIPLAVLLPMIGILSVTSEWSQRSGLTTFTLVPRRGRVIAAKLVAVLALAVASMVAAFAVGAVGNLVSALVLGQDPVWDMGLAQFAHVVLGNVLGVLFGFMLAVLLRSSAVAIVCYFVYMLLLPSLSGLLAQTQEWYRDLQPWVDFQMNQVGVFDGDLSATQWQQLAVTSAIWLVLPLAVGLARVVRAEVK